MQLLGLLKAFESPRQGTNLVADDESSCDNLSIPAQAKPERGTPKSSLEV
jgi:hypothetical protein